MHRNDVGLVLIMISRHPNVRSATMTMTAIPHTRKVVHYDLPAGLSDKIVEMRSWRNRSKELVECFKKSCVCVGEESLVWSRFIHSFVCL